MFNVDINSVQRVAASLVAALLLSATCVGLAVAPAAAGQIAPVASVSRA